MDENGVSPGEQIDGPIATSKDIMIATETSLSSLLESTTSTSALVAASMADPTVNIQCLSNGIKVSGYLCDVCSFLCLFRQFSSFLQLSRA